MRKILDMRKILFVLEQMNIGGPQKSLLGLLDHIDFENNKVYILTMKNEGMLLRYLDGRVAIIHAPALYDAYTFPVNRIRKTLKTLFKEGGWGLSVRAFLMLLKHMLLHNSMSIQRQKFWMENHQYLPSIKEEFDIAFGYSTGLATYCVVDCVKAKYKCHWVRSDYRTLNLDTSIEEHYFKQVDGVVAVSKLCKEIFVNTFPLLKNKSTFFYNYEPVQLYKSMPGVNLREKRKREEVRIISVSRIDENKGLELIIDACVLLQGKLEFTWFVVGDGSARRCYEDLAKDKGVEKDLLFLGFQLNVPSCLEQCDIFVHASHFEGKSNAVDEAMNRCMPVITTNYPTVAEQVEDGVTGIVCGMSGLFIAESIIRMVKEKLYDRFSNNCSLRNNEREGTEHLFQRIVKAEYVI